MNKLDIPNHPDPQPREVTLDELYEAVEDCSRCMLSDNGMLEMGIGNEKARVAVVIDAPDMRGGYKERMALIESLIAPAHLTLDDVYVTTLIKCPLLPDRQPTSFEIDACSAILREEIRSVWPEVIICMGSMATRFFLHSEVGVDTLHGRMYRRGHFQILPTFHINQLMRDELSLQVAQSTIRKLGVWLEKHSAQ